MSSQVVITARFTPKNEKARNELLTSLEIGSESALKNESGTLKYAFGRSLDETDGDIYIVEQYADQAALTHHMGQPYVQKLLEWTQSGTLANAPEVSALDQLEGLEFARSEVSTHPDPLLVFTELEYKPGGAETILPYWRAVFEKTQNDEPGALLWQLAKDTNNPDKLFVLHVHESRDYLMTVHASSKELKECQSFGENIQTGMKPRFLKIQGGFLYKSE